MLASPEERKLAAEIAKLVHADKKWEAAKFVAEFCLLKVNLKDPSPARYMPVLQNWLHFLLNSDAPEEAAQLLWTPNQFTPEPNYTKEVWKFYKETGQGLVMGAASCSKSFGLGVRLFLEWIRDPDWTSVRIIGPSQDHLEANLFSHLASLHTSASLPMPGTIGELFIGDDRRNQLGSIKGVIIPVGKTKKAGRLQGGKRKPRSSSHPRFGPLSRMFIFVDEIENVPGGLWSDVDNVLTQVDEEGSEGFKIFGAYNPTNRTDEVGKRAEPDFGWENVVADKHYRWKSKRGWDVLRLDGEQSENVIHNKIVFPGLQTRNGLNVIAKNSGGRDSGGYATMGRGMYPSGGVTSTIIPPGMFPKWRGEFIWLDSPEPVASCDLALDGGAACCFTLGKWGKATGMKLPANIEHPQGYAVMFKDKMGQVVPRWGLQADQQFSLDKGDTVAQKDKLISLCRKTGIKPRFFCCDATGAGRGVGDMMKNEWSTEIHAINYSEGPSDGKVFTEDTQTCAQEYDRLCSELWFALRVFGEHGYLLLAPSLDVTNLTSQVTQRLSKSAGKKSRVESKADYISRGHTSPDQADSLTLFVLAARRGSGMTLSHLGDEIGIGESDEWYDQGFHGGCRIDITNRTEFLESVEL